MVIKDAALDGQGNDDSRVAYEKFSTDRHKMLSSFSTWIEITKLPKPALSEEIRSTMNAMFQLLALLGDGK